MTNLLLKLPIEDCIVIADEPVSTSLLYWGLLVAELPGFATWDAAEVVAPISLCVLGSIPTWRSFFLMQEFQKFLISLSVRPGSCVAICDHLPHTTQVKNAISASSFNPAEQPFLDHRISSLCLHLKSMQCSIHNCGQPENRSKKIEIVEDPWTSFFLQVFSLPAPITSTRKRRQKLELGLFGLITNFAIPLCLSVSLCGTL